MKRLSIVTIVFLVFILGSVSVYATNYYVSNSGNDTNAGTTPESAWRTIEKINHRTLLPGDSVLFECGGVWSGCLWVKGSGTKLAPIKIDSYGSGSKPCINGSGNNAAVYLYNQEYITVSGLEITNTGTETWKYGVYVSANDCGELNGIKLKNLTVHDVTGMYSGQYTREDTNEALDNHWNGGIVVMARGNATATRFKGLSITGCEVYDVSRTGILCYSNYNTAFDKKVNGMSQNLNVIDNTVHDIAGDGILIAGDYGGVVNNNIAYDTNMMSYNGISSANVGIWGLHCTGTTFSENESYLCHTTNDGFGFDIDGDNDNVTFEYNYSHDNDGGFILLVNHNTHNAVVRYNISQNDGHQSIAVASPVTNTALLDMTASVYNNTIYSKVSQRHRLINVSQSSVVPKRLEIYNNIFYIDTSSYVYNNNVSNTDKVIMSNNLYYGNNYVSALSRYDNTALCIDPMLKAPGSGGIGLSTLSGYELLEKSPCINAGRVIEDNGGYDFWGNVVSSVSMPNVGAYED
ncbi:MAG: right-handed parallel beta-helix repeat-containing protein [Clostridia bacterium]|nr:right-handed parallel beta-helix repeat-containing protein [Clostridia bacterium]